MFSFVRSVLGNVRVVERDGIVDISGVPARCIHNDIGRLYSTNKIAANAMLHLDSSSFSFPSFFALDFFKIFTDMSAQSSFKTSVRTISKIVDGLKENTWIGNLFKDYTSRLDLSRLKILKYPPLELQLNSLNAYSEYTQKMKLNGYLFNSAPGTGKTYMSLALSLALRKKVTIIIAPLPTIHEVWVNALDPEVGDPKRVVFKEKQKYWYSTSGDLPTPGYDYYIVHYEYLEKFYVFARTHLKNQDALIVQDESHNFNDIKSNRTSMLLSLCSVMVGAEVLLLSGTPLKALAVETIPFFRAIDKLFTEDVEKRFTAIYKATSGKAVEILSYRLGMTSFKVEKKEINLPDMINTTVPVKMPNGDEYTLDSIKKKMQEFAKARTIYYEEHRAEHMGIFDNYIKKHKSSISPLDHHLVAEYQQYEYSLKQIIKHGPLRELSEEMKYCNSYEARRIEPELFGEDLKEFRDLKAAVKYPSLKIRGECLGRVLVNIRTEYAADIAKQIDYVQLCESSKMRVVVFTSYIESLEAGLESAKKQGLSPIAAYSGSGRSLPETLSIFNGDESVNPLFTTYKTLSTGVPLTECDTIAIIDTPFRDATLIQTMSRVHRNVAGREPIQTYSYTYSLDTGDVPNICDRNIDILKWSQQQVEAMLGTPPLYIIGEADTGLEDYRPTGVIQW